MHNNAGLTPRSDMPQPPAKQASFEPDSQVTGNDGDGLKKVDRWGPKTKA